MPNNELTLLGFDFGTKYIGVATGQSITQTATPLTTLKARDGEPRWEEVKRLVEQWSPDALVIGIPLNMDGTESDMSQKARAFAHKLSAQTNLPVHECDERLTTHEAKSLLLELYGPKALEKTTIDSFAAKLIVESWMNSL